MTTPEVQVRLESEREWLLHFVGPDMDYRLKAVIEYALKNLNYILAHTEAIAKAVGELDKYAIDGECDGLGDHVYFGKLTPNERKIDDDYDASLVHYLMKSEVLSAIRKAGGE